MTPVHHPWASIGNHTFPITLLLFLGGKINLWQRWVHATLNLMYLNPCHRTTLGRLVKTFLKCLNVNQRENFLAVLNPTHKILTAPITWSLFIRCLHYEIHILENYMYQATTHRLEGRVILVGPLFRPYFKTVRSPYSQGLPTLQLCPWQHLWSE